MTTSILLTPLEHHLKQIKYWLIKERTETGEGFYCNWSVIQKCYERNEFAVLMVDDSAAGLACWESRSALSAELHIVEIRAGLRGTGLGAFFVEALFKFFADKGICALNLQCVPEDSERFWRRFGFEDMPLNLPYRDRQTTYLFKRLIPCQPQTFLSNKTNYIELWDAEPLEARNTDSVWKWNIELQLSGKLNLPVIQPCDKDWRMKLVIDGEVVIDDKIKRFRRAEVLYDSYLVLTQVSDK